MQSVPLTLEQPDLLCERGLVAGKWIASDSGETLPVYDKASGAVIGRVPMMKSAETRRAIEAAEAAWPAWRARTAKDRATILQRWFALIEQNSEDLARLMTAEQGKPLAEARAEVRYAASFIEWFAEEGKRVYGEVVPSPQSDRRILVLRQPIGVCAAITPWNFPLAMVTRKVGPALAAGNPIVVKPAETTPFSALALALLAERAGVPPGVLQVVTGDPLEIGRELTAHPSVRKLSFTGSTEVGRLLYAQSAPTLKKLSLELGGNAPFIVFDDADIEAAVEGAVAAKFRNTGQTCVCVNRFYVHERVYERFAALLVKAVARLPVGAGTDPDVKQGPLIDQAAVRKVAGHIDDAVAKGAKVLLGGQPHALGGNFFEPTVLSEVRADMRLAKEETFGPIAALFRFTDDEEVVRLANDTEFGLASYFYSRDLARVFRTAERLEYGMVGVNTGAISTEVAPFGGVKQSGMGREGSRHGIEDYLVTKYVALAGIDG